MATAEQITTLRDYINDSASVKYTDAQLTIYIDSYTFPECAAVYVWRKEMAIALAATATKLKKSSGELKVMSINQLEI